MSKFTNTVKARRAAVSVKHPHMIVIAKAGCGKTSTACNGIRRMRGMSIPWEPTEQQLAIWECLARSQDAKTVVMTAFNKKMAEELQEQAPPGVQCMTLHSLGFKAVRNAFGRATLDDKERFGRLVSELTERTVDDLWENDRMLIADGGCKKLVNMVKANLIDVDRSTDDVYSDFDLLCEKYSIDLIDEQTEKDYTEEIYPLVVKLINRMKRFDGFIEFGDMIWLPVVLNLPVDKVDLLIVDEAQDMNPCQQRLVMKAGKRLMVIGDHKQAIYGFTGADIRGLQTFEEILKATPEGCESFPLNVTMRCAKSIVRACNKLVPDFYAHPNNPEGETPTVTYDTYQEKVQDGDMVVCRLNAPLVSQCLKFLAEGRKASILGRDIVEGLVSLIRRQNASDVPELARKIEDWYICEYNKEAKKKRPSESKIMNLGDKKDCILMFCEGLSQVQDVLNRIYRIFTEDPDKKAIVLSTIHKAKGLEADGVFFINTKFAPCPHPMAKTEWAQEQEQNLIYVAQSRGKTRLYFVVDGVGGQKKNAVKRPVATANAIGL
jgi:DNA helicase-2/ATP-dependent DNA helicase PcrA